MSCYYRRQEPALDRRSHGQCAMHRARLSRDSRHEPQHCDKVSLLSTADGCSPLKERLTWSLVRVCSKLIGELCLKVELLISRMFEDKSYPIEADDTIVGQVRLQLALFNDEIMDEDEIRDCDVDGCSCALTQPVRATKVGDVLIDGISPHGVQYLEAGTAVHTGCEIAGNYVIDKDVYEGDSWEGDNLDSEPSGSDEWEGDEL